MNNCKSIVLAIETSCDETAVAIVRSDRKILAHHVLSQITEHAPYGGVVPEIAARSHINHLESLVYRSLDDANLKLNQLTAIAATTGPGLIGGIIVGVMTAKAMATACELPFIAVNHLMGHALTARLTHENLDFPFLVVLMSGGHCQVLIAHSVEHYEVLSKTIDDAVGEAFDKVAKMCHLGYPGGPIIEQRALNGNQNAYHFPMPLQGKDTANFSFSGLKTAVKRVVDHEITIKNTLDDKFIADISASFQKTVGKIFEDRLSKCLSKYKSRFPNASQVVIAGGVAANQYLRSSINELCSVAGLQLIAPPLSLCTDNAAMIAWAGIELLQIGKTSPLNSTPKARWPLDELKG